VKLIATPVHDSEVQIDNDYKKIQSLLKCSSFTTGAFLGGSLAKGFDSIYVVAIESARG
jgi:hypothetical protein